MTILSFFFRDKTNICLTLPGNVGLMNPDSSCWMDAPANNFQNRDFFNPREIFIKRQFSVKLVVQRINPSNCICVFVVVKKNGGLTSKIIENFGIFWSFWSKNDVE